MQYKQNVRIALRARSQVVLKSASDAFSISVSYKFPFSPILNRLYSPKLIKL